MLKIINLQWKDIHVKCFRIFSQLTGCNSPIFSTLLSDFQKNFHVKYLVNLILLTAFYRILLERAMCQRVEISYFICYNVKNYKIHFGIGYFFGIMIPVLFTV